MNLLPTRAQRVVLLVAATAVASFVLAVTLAPFAVSGRAPFFTRDALTLGVLQRCRDLPPRAERHACLRDVAQASRQASAARVARAP